ncbi:MAG TPA: phosphoribosyltransferase [Methylomusa anaerophila]|uniref:Adenine phosphoribosyltransferase n=1 Tax=Methylomusa anaerophila TaxID=1930071 RepID=A0A348AER4_9FIRM|nr:phosphoribosyltransferase [Methylomusa anaerophila]BBB89562.1 adenine phosphoribosyltransferase [Methylomusa anaerophila]HML90070.1 phosphoribosyltransferase [Methylomusa anaerophila]
MIPQIQIEKIKGYNSSGIGMKINSDIEGALFPVNYKLLDEASDILVSKMNSDQIDLIIGLAGRGIIPAFILAQKLKKPLQIAYKNRLSLPNEIIVTEEHSRNKNLYFYINSMFENKRICIVDDEITSGNTFLNVYKELNSKGFVVNCFVAYIENGRNGRILLENRDAKLYTVFQV